MKKQSIKYEQISIEYKHTQKSQGSLESIKSSYFWERIEEQVHGLCFNTVSILITFTSLNQKPAKIFSS